MEKNDIPKNARISIRVLRYEKLKQRLIQALKSETFYRYGLKQQQLLLNTLQRYAKQLFGSNNALSTLSHPRLDKTVLLSALTALIGSTGNAQCDQNFVAEGGLTPFGLQDIGTRAKPTFVDIDNDGDLDAFIGNYNGFTLIARNIGSSTAPVFVAFTGSGLPDIGTSAAPTFVDIDKDGDLDAFIGNKDGYTQFFRNTGTSAIPAFTPEGGAMPFGLLDISYSAAPTFADIDNDGDLDAFIGNGYGYTQFFRNTGSPTAPAFTLQGGAMPFGLPEIGLDAVPTFADIDKDGDLDAFIGNNDGNTKFFRNTGSPTVPAFTPEGGSTPFGLPADVGNNAAPTFVDIDKDGDLDAFIGNNDGNTQFFRAPCVPTPKPPIPTMSQWGLLIFTLLMVNLGLMTLKRKEELLAGIRK